MSGYEEVFVCVLVSGDVVPNDSARESRPRRESTESDLESG
jgi:hypothetical protein